MKKRTKRAMIVLLTLISFDLGLIIPFAYSSKTTKEADLDPIQTKTETIAEIKSEEIASVQEEINENIYFNVPLSHELQDFIFDECKAKGIDPAIVISMIAQESNYKSNEIGDNGDSLGLMQIQPKWHKERMQRLACNDLLDPYQNIKVGIDLIYELNQENPNLYFVLMAYNGGRNYAYKRIDSGNISDYALEVIERSQQLKTIGG